MKALLFFSVSAVLLHLPSLADAQSHRRADECYNWTTRHPAWIWCDDFEQDRPLGTHYADYDDDGGDFVRTADEHVSGWHSLRARWQEGEVDAGSLMQSFGRHPGGASKIQPDKDFEEIYWRLYLKLQPGFVGNPGKLTRATILARSNWAQAMVGHLWFHGKHPGRLVMDPATGVRPPGVLKTSKYNDFENFRWLGQISGPIALEAGRWYCIESHIKLNTPGLTNGVFEYWIDDALQKRRIDLDWRNVWREYGINAIFISNYWNEGSPVQQDRFVDAFVISTKRIGCQ